MFSPLLTMRGHYINFIYIQVIMLNVKDMSTQMARTTQIVPTRQFDIPMQTLKNEIQAKIDNEGLGCIVEKVWKVRGIASDQDCVVVETLVPAASPVSSELVIMLLMLIIGVVGLAYIVTEFNSFREHRLDEYGKTVQLLYDVIDGMQHATVEDMIKWKMENHPDHFEQYPFWCPYCGCEFKTEEERENHVKICPDAPLPPPPYPEGGWSLGYYLQYAVSIVGYRSTLPFLGKLFGRVT